MTDALISALPWLLAGIGACVVRAFHRRRQWRKRMQRMADAVWVRAALSRGEPWECPLCGGRHDAVLTECPTFPPTEQTAGACVVAAWPRRKG